jgi:DNA-directed RNA polymerase specialized sigma24 family protein
MTNKDKIRWLKQYKMLERQVTIRMDKIDWWRSQLGKVTPTLSSQPAGGGSIYKTPQFDLINKIVDIQDTLYQEIDVLEKLRLAIQEAIHGLDDQVQKTMLEYRYIDGMTWEWIASEMHYSWKWTHVLHKRALTAITMPCEQIDKVYT